MTELKFSDKDKQDFKFSYKNVMNTQKHNQHPHVTYVCVLECKKSYTSFNYDNIFDTEVLKVAAFVL